MGGIAHQFNVHFYPSGADPWQSDAVMDVRDDMEAQELDKTYKVVMPITYQTSCCLKMCLALKFQD